MYSSVLDQVVLPWWEIPEPGEAAMRRSWLASASNWTSISSSICCSSALSCICLQFAALPKWLSWSRYRGRRLWRVSAASKIHSHSVLASWKGYVLRLESLCCKRSTDLNRPKRPYTGRVPVRSSASILSTCSSCSHRLEVVGSSKQATTCLLHIARWSRRVQWERGSADLDQTGKWPM